MWFNVSWDVTGRPWRRFRISCIFGRIFNFLGLILYYSEE